MAQKRQNVYFFTNNNNQVSTKDSADFIRIVSEPDSGSELYNVNDYYKNGKPKFIGKSSQVEHLVFDGSYVSFYPSGKRQRLSNYQKGQISGDSYEYYPNGKLYAIKEYISGPKFPGDYLFGNFLLKTCNDSTGKTLATDGNGYAIIYNLNTNKIDEEGNVNKGLKQGIWKGQFHDGGEVTYTENYEQGKFVSGKSADKDGKVYNYTSDNVPGHPVGIDDPFFKAINIGHKKPPVTNIHDTIMVSFYIEKDGTISGFKLIGENIDDKLTADIYAIAAKTKWIPGTSHGIPIRDNVTIPYNY